MMEIKKIIGYIGLLPFYIVSGILFILLIAAYSCSFFKDVCINIINGTKRPIRSVLEDWSDIAKRNV